MRIVLALLPSVEERMLESAIVAGHEILARPGSSTELAAIIASTRPEAVIVSATPSLLGASVVEASDDAAARLVVLARGAAEQSAAAALGLHAVLEDTAEWADVSAALAGRSPAQPAVPVRAPGADGRVIAVWGPAGAPGRTSISIALAAALAAGGARVALVDADPYGGAVAASLGLLDEAPGIAAACRLAGSGGLDLAQLERICARVPCRSGAIRVLTGLTRPSRWTELSYDRVAETLAVARRWAEYVLVDTGFSIETDEEIVSDLLAPRRNAATLAALDSADRVLAVGTADPVGLSRLLRARAELADVVDAAAVSVVVNRVRRGPVGVSPASRIEGILDRFGGFAPDGYIPYDRAAFDAALLRAVPVQEAAPRSAAAAAITRIAGELAEAVAAPGAPTREAAHSRFAPAW